MVQALKQVLFIFFAGSFFLKASAQTGLCPSNLDFEQGDFSGWDCLRWTAAAPTPIPGPFPGRHTIVSAPTSGLDLYGNFPTLCPNGSNYSVKLGNSGVGGERESVSYTYTIPTTVTTFSMLFYYAVVLEDPVSNPHTPLQRPRFEARIVDVATGLPIPCVDFDFIATANLPGFRRSAINSNVWYKDWTPISLNLTSSIGRTIRLEFITSDCSLGGHFGYAYLDVGTSCNGAITGNYICPGDPSITLTAPFGFQNYTWYADNTFTTILSTTQTLLLNPPPPVGSVYPVIVEPYPGFGCLDTLYAVVDVGAKPVSTAGPDKIICKKQQVQIGGPPVTGYAYSWVPAAEVSNPTASNPFARPATTNPTEYIVTTRDILTGCTSKDTTIVSTYSVDTALTVAGLPDFCAGYPPPLLSVKNTSTAVQWHEVTAGPIPGASGVSYRPGLSGIYWAEVTQGGCLDSTRQYQVFRHETPIVTFTPSNDTGCVTKNSLTFTNNANAPDNAAMTHLWKFSDGITDINTNAVRTFARTGAYNVKLITTTEFGCKDSTNQDVHIMPNGVPDFTWDSICTGRPMTFTNLSNENRSPQAWYIWNFNNGGPLSVQANPLPVTYNTPPGQLDVTLQMVTLGCENDTQTVVKKVQVNRQKPGYTYRTITVPQGSSQWLHVRDSIGAIYNWRPPVHLSSSTTQYTEFFADGDDVKYLIDITDPHTCVTTDTIQMLVLKKPGFYLPTAFTPNSDGLNDLARPYLIGMKGLKSFSIYNRGGQLIYFTQTYGKGWDGKYKGVDQASGVFIWVVEYYDAGNRPVMQKGTLTLIR